MSSDQSSETKTASDERKTGDRGKSIESILREIGLQRFVGNFSRKNCNFASEIEHCNFRLVKHHFGVPNTIDANRISNAIRRANESRHTGQPSRVSLHARDMARQAELKVERKVQQPKHPVHQPKQPPKVSSGRGRPASRPSDRPADRHHSHLSCPSGCPDFRLRLDRALLFDGAVFSLTGLERGCAHVSRERVCVAFDTESGRAEMQLLTRFNPPDNQFKCVSADGSHFSLDPATPPANEKARFMRRLADLSQLRRFLQAREARLTSRARLQARAMHARQQALTDERVEQRRLQRLKAHYELEDYQMLSRDESLADVFFDAKTDVADAFGQCPLGDEDVEGALLDPEALGELDGGEELWVFMRQSWKPFVFSETYVIGEDEEFGFIATHKHTGRRTVFPVQKRFLDDNEPHLPPIYVRKQNGSAVVA